MQGHHGVKKGRLEAGGNQGLARLNTEIAENDSKGTEDNRPVASFGF
jgi:hypothetical protein